MGAVIRIEHNHFVNMKNPVMSMYSQQVGFWQLIDNIFENISWQEGAAGSVIADDNVSTGELNVPYDYQSSLIPVYNVKQTVLRYAGVGIIDTPPSPGLCPAPEPVDPQQSGGVDEPNHFTVNGDGTVTFDSTVNGADRSRAKISNVLASDAPYPKFFTLLMGVQGNTDGQRILEAEIALGDAGAYTPEMLKGLLPPSIGDISGYE